jgi:nitrite reductase/ring-hydroxylating ferredoxin subunit
MPEIFVAKIAQFPDGERRIVSHGTREIGVFHWQGEFYACENLCLHQGGPACEGLLMHKVEDVTEPDRSWHGQKFSEHEIHFVCPWHGYEYDLKIGQCAADRELRLKSFEVVRRGSAGAQAQAERLYARDVFHLAADGDVRDGGAGADFPHDQGEEPAALLIRLSALGLQFTLDDLRPAVSRRAGQA